MFHVKPSLFSKKLASIFLKLDINNSYILDGFHLDFFLSLYRSLQVPAFILLPDNLFGLVLKYLSVLHEDHLVAFIPPVVAGGPSGFVSKNSFQIRRSRGLLSSGVGSVSFVVCAESGLSLPLVGCDSADKLNFSSNVDYDDCLDFFSENNYRHVDVVLDPGDYSVRGGLLDVYPFFSTFPVRISFLDDDVVARRIDVQSQLSTDTIEGLCITAKQKKDLISFEECSLAGFLCLFYNPDGTMKTNNAPPVGFSDVYTCLSHDDFVSRGGLESNNVHVDDALSSVGVLNNLDKFIEKGLEEFDKIDAAVHCAYPTSSLHFLLLLIYQMHSIFQKSNYEFYFPLTSMLIISVILTLAFNFFSRFFK